MTKKEMTPKEARAILEVYEAEILDTLWLTYEQRKGLNEALDMGIKALEQTNKIEESNFSTEQYKADLQGAYDCGYNCGYTDAMSDIAESEDEE